jgi:hypothetical protein
VSVGEFRPLGLFLTHTFKVFLPQLECQCPAPDTDTDTDHAPAAVSVPEPVEDKSSWGRCPLPATGTDTDTAERESICAFEEIPYPYRDYLF